MLLSKQRLIAAVFKQLTTDDILWLFLSKRRLIVVVFKQVMTYNDCI